MRKAILIGFAVSAFLGTAGFKLFESLEERNNGALAKSSDPALATAYWPSPLPSAGQYRTTLYDNLIEIEQDKFRYAATPAEFAQKRMQEDSSRDQIAQIFIATAKARGDTVRLYKSPVNKTINSILAEERISNYYVANRYDLDPALIEFSPDGRVVSALVRVAKVGRNIATLDGIFCSRIYFGTNKTLMENHLGNRFLDDNLIQ